MPPLIEGEGAGERAPAVPGAVSAEVLSNERVAGEIHCLRLSARGAWGPPVPGQFVSITLEPPWNEDAPGDVGTALLRRPFGVASFEADGERIVVGLLYASLGRVTRRMKALGPGARVDLLGPLGRGFPLHGARSPVLVAGGRGIGPLLFLAEALSAARLPFALLYGARAATEMIALPEFREADVRLATDDGSRGRRATAIDLLDDLDIAGAARIFACGPRAMLAAAARVARGRGWDCWTSVEEMFGCGLGLCGSCAVPVVDAADEYQRFLWACRDGPVLRAASVDWEAWERRGEAGKRGCGGQRA